jgi:hypothetical protein
MTLLYFVWKKTKTGFKRSVTHMLVVHVYFYNKLIQDEFSVMR